jgi:choline-sulfatase
VGGGFAVAVAIGAAAGVMATRPPPPRPERPYNVVLIVVDTLRADHLGAWGHPRDTSPHLDRFAARSRRFARAWSQAAWTTASVGSLMTSAYPTALGLEEEHSVLQDDAWTLAEALAAAGLDTAAVVSHWFCADEYGFGQGFDTFDDSHVLGHVGVSSERVTDAGLAWLDQREGQAPFFLWLHYFDPHFAYTLHDGHDFAPDSEYAGPVRDEMRFSQLSELALEPPDVAQLQRLYDSEIAYTDRQIGRVLDRLDELGLTDQTLVIFTADHGEEFLEHGRLGHGKTVYEEMIHVPLIVGCPHWEPGVVDVPAANLDIFPTALACLGLPEPAGLEGRALGPAVPAPRTVFSQTGKRNRILAARSGDLKLIRDRGGNVELYDLAADPGEQRDLSERAPPGLAPLAAELDVFRRRLRKSANLPVRNQPSAELRDQLEALGYSE